MNARAHSGGDRADAGLAPVRSEVRKLLEESSTFQALDPHKQRALAHDLVKVGAFLAEPGWLDERPTSDDETERPAEALAAVDDLRQRLASDPGQVGQDFEAGAVRQGVDAFKRMVDTVDFPDFVSGLIQGVFRSIVDASIEQMKAYGELLSAVAKSVDQFANENITDAQARDHVASRYPTIVRVDTSGERPVLADNPEGEEGGEEEGADRIAREMGLEGLDLSDPASEQAMVNAAKLEMARQRQQLLATMVLMGINRIVVTNGRINAKVLFDMRASDEAASTSQAAMSDRSESKMAAAAAAWSPWGAAGAGMSKSHVATVSSSRDESSESSAEVKARLSGEVRVSFKSDVFPLERMADSADLAMLGEKARPVSRNGNNRQQTT